MGNVVIFNETDFVENIYDFYTFMYYKGKPFTGILLNGNETIEFKDGNADGRCVEYFDNGQIAYYQILEQGNYVSGKEWYRNGQLKYDSIGKEWYENGQPKKDSTGTDDLWWDAEGNLAKKNNSWLYKNGVIKQCKDAVGDRLTFVSNGDLAIKEVLNKEPFVDHNSQLPIVYYFDAVLSQYYEELITNEYPELEQNAGDYIQLISGWVDKVYHSDIQRGKLLIAELMNHHDKYVKQHANSLNQLALNKESGNQERTYWLDNNPKHIIIY